MSSIFRFQRLALWVAFSAVALLACNQGDDKVQPEATEIKAAAASATDSRPFTPAETFRKKPLVYVVDSYNPETFGWTREINAGIKTGFQKRGLVPGENIELVHATLDAYVNSSPEALKVQGQRILEDIRRKKPDLVLTTDDDALVWVGLALEEMPVVFNGVNGDPGKYLSSPLIDSIEKPGHNITGVYQTTYYHQSLALLKKIHPSARTFGVLSDTTTTGQALLNAMKALDPQSLPLEWKKTLVSDQFAQWQDALQAWQGQVDVVYLLSANAVTAADGRLMSSDEAINWIRDNSQIPEVSCWAYQVKAGVLASATDDGVKQGEMSAKLALKILGGAPPGGLPMSTPPNGVPAINLTRAEKLGISVPQNLVSLLIEQGVIYH